MDQSHTAGSRANAAVRGALYAHSLPAATRTPALRLLRAVNNAGIGAGAALGAGVAALDHHGAYQAAILADALTFLLALLPLRAVPAVHPATGGFAGRPGAADRTGGSDRPDSSGPPGRRPGALRDRPYLAVTALNAIVNMLYVVLEVALPLWLAGYTSAPVPWSASSSSSTPSSSSPSRSGPAVASPSSPPPYGPSASAACSPPSPASRLPRPRTAHRPPPP